MKNFFVAPLFVLGCLMTNWGAHAQQETAPTSRTLTLPSTWLVQPATDSKTAPNDEIWGSIELRDWRNGTVKGVGPKWSAVERKDVNSLWLEQKVDIPTAWQGKRIFADFSRLDGDAIVFLNGTRLQELLRPGGEVELTSQVRWGQNNALRVFLTREYKDISRNFEQDWIRYYVRQKSSSPLLMEKWPMGSTAPVTLIAKPQPAALNSVFVQTSWRQKTLTLDIETDAKEATDNLVAVGEVFDANGKNVITARSAAFSAPKGLSHRPVSTAWDNPTPWELDAGYLYTVRVRLERNGQRLDQLAPISFGFREIWTQGRQLLMNGHPVQFRLASLMQGGESNVNSIRFFRNIGYNVFVFQDHGSLWWRDRGEYPIWDETALDYMDKIGGGITLPAPSISYALRPALTEPGAIADFEREMEFYQRLYRNRPSILAWTVGMNTYNPRSAIWAQGMGRRDKTNIPQVHSIQKVIDIAHKFDPTRLSYSHADGGIGDLATSNMYLNFAPLQEREEWPSAWATDGEMPYMGAEFGQPYTANFWKDKRFLLTEYLAMYFGDQAYATEKESGLRKSIEYGLKNATGHGAMKAVDLSEFPSYWDFQRLFVRNTNRSWRAWGVNGGWSNWVYDIGYGNPPNVKVMQGYENSRYRDMTAEMVDKPDWVSPNYEIHQQANQPLLAYIAGAPVATDKTHAFYGGQTVQKQVAIDWDGPGDQTVALNWSVAATSGTKTPFGAGQAQVTLKAGETKFQPVNFTAPTVKARTEYIVSMTARDQQGKIQTDSFAVQVFPPVQNTQSTAQVALYDPVGLSEQWISRLDLKTTAWNVGDDLGRFDVLIIGREALGQGRKPPYKPADIARGLKVLILEQRPEVWQGMGFKINGTMSRYVFARDKQNPILNGIQAADLINWAGSPNLLPEGVTQPGEEQHAPKWTNRHAVASVTLQVPETAGFSPVLVCEFDLNYSPLLQMNYGKGQINFCTLDFSGRVGQDAAATLLARNLLQAATATIAPRRKLQVVGDSGALLKQLQFDAIAADFSTPTSSLIVVGSGINAATRKKLDGFVRAGGTAFHLTTPAAQLRELGYKTQSSQLVKAATSNNELMRGVGLGLLRWRDTLDVEAFSPSGQPAGSTVLCDGIALVQNKGQGREVFLQVRPEKLATRYSDDVEKQTALQTSVIRLRQLIAQMLTNAGAGVSPVVMQRVSLLKVRPTFQALESWQALGPFPFDKDDGDAMLDAQLPGEADAIAGDTNPNNTYKLANGKELDWRKIVRTDNRDYIDLASQLKSPVPAIAFLSQEISSTTARKATLTLGADYRLQVWVNGQQVFRTIKGQNKANAYQVEVPLKAGKNIITMKVGSGSRGFGVWPALSSEASDLEQAATMIPEVDLYQTPSPDFDPYQFHYW